MNLLILCATASGRKPAENVVANQIQRVSAKLLGLEAYEVGEQYDAHGGSTLVLYKTDHEKVLAMRLAHMAKCPSIFVVENVAVRHDRLYGVGGWLLSASGADHHYVGAHDDVVLHLSAKPTMKVHEFQLPPVFGGLYLSFK